MLHYSTEIFVNGQRQRILIFVILQQKTIKKLVEPLIKYFENCSQRKEVKCNEILIKMIRGVIYYKINLFFLQQKFTRLF